MPKFIYRHTNIKGKEIVCVATEDDGSIKKTTFVTAIPTGCRFVGGRYEKYVDSLEPPKPVEPKIEQTVESKPKPQTHAVTVTQRTWLPYGNNPIGKIGGDEEKKAGKATRVVNGAGVKMTPREIGDCFSTARHVTNYQKNTIVMWHALVRRSVGVDPLFIGREFPKIEIDVGRNIIKVWEKKKNIDDDDTRPTVVIRDCLVPSANLYLDSRKPD